MAIEGQGAQAAARTTPHGPRARLHAEIHRLIQAHSPKGAVLEIATDERDLATPSIAYFYGGSAT